MYRIISGPTSSLYPLTMDQHFRLRRSIFVNENGWSEFDVDGIHEKDSYDTADTIYSIAIGSREDVVGGFRLVPTKLPHMLSENFAYLVEGSPVRRADVMEMSRFHLSPEVRGSKAVYLESFAAMMELGLELGLSAYTCIIRTMRIPMFQSGGIKAEPLGMPADFDGESSSAMLVHVSEESLAAVNQRRGEFVSVLEHNQPRRLRA